MKKFFRFLLKLFFILIIPITLVFLVVRQCNKNKNVTYKTVSMKVGNIEKKIIVTGKILPQKEITIKPQGISGIIERLYVKEGAQVRKGDRIAKLTVIPDEANLTSAQSRITNAKIDFTNKEREYKRSKALFEKDVISKTEFENSETVYLTAKEDLKVARENYQIVRTGARIGSKTANTVIRSTMTGMVLDIPVEEGNSVIASNNFNDGTTIASIADMRKMLFKGQVDETEVAKMEKGMQIDIVIGALNEKSFKAKVEFISPKGKEEQGVVKFDLEAKLLLEKGEFIRAGYSANASIVVDKKDSVPIIKEAYINFKNDSAFVEVLENKKPQKFKEKAILVGLSDGINIEVLSGLSEKDKIKTTEVEDKKSRNKKSKKKR